MEDQQTIINKLNELEKKIDLLLENDKWQKKQWENSESFSGFIKRWGGFYVASLLADETIKQGGRFK